MSSVIFPENSQNFFKEVQEWLSKLPAAFQLSTGNYSEEFWLNVEGKNGRSLALLLRPLIEFSQEDSKGSITSKTARHVTLWEDQWYTKRQIVQSRLKALLGISERIPARLTQVRRLDRPTTSNFLKENHLQDATITKYKYGLFLPEKHFRVLAQPPANDELLVAIATFARPRIFDRAEGPHRSYELVRFANLLSTTVVGGLDKLLSHFVKEHQPDDIMTYADLEWSSGVSYQKLGFETHGDTPPQEFWVDPATMQRCYPHRLPDEITEDSATNHGIVKIKNAGSRKFVKNFLPQSHSN
ncbi:hypothetical protein [Persicitalea sp.]|uniref:hypothetical protein n=1 Tax=Persicitalea sp. TaxID=3100273 RepID=UPI0035943AE3